MKLIKNLEKELMTSTLFLYLVFFIAIFNILLLVQLKFYVYVVLFIVLSLVTYSGFNQKNMIMVLLVPIISINLILFIRNIFVLEYNYNNYHKVIEGNQEYL
tara:strand:- start:9671 stop:9976 length:306 start_codon:yes stop_codon:yes gene_type:complete